MSFFSHGLGLGLLILGQCLLIVVPLLVALAFLLYADRKIWAAVQLRRGPNVVGVFGLLQSFADFLKYITKEVVIPAGADRFVFFLAPLLSFALATAAWAVTGALAAATAATAMATSVKVGRGSAEPSSCVMAAH